MAASIWWGSRYFGRVSAVQFWHWLLDLLIGLVLLSVRHSPWGRWRSAGRGALQVRMRAASQPPSTASTWPFT